jgi:SHS2 domain-containing protein
MPAHFELFDHTADVGVRAHAATLHELIQAAADGLYAVIGTLCVDRQAAATPQLLEFCGDDSALLLRDFLDELLYRFGSNHQKAVVIDVVEYSANRLAANVVFAPVDLERCSLASEVKAVTYHALAVRAVAGGYEAIFIVDI